MGKFSYFRIYEYCSQRYEQATVPGWRRLWRLLATEAYLRCMAEEG